jgi:ferric-dicitrate binding protein FerR (iron transport regulator)
LAYSFFTEKVKKSYWPIGLFVFPIVSLNTGLTFPPNCMINKERIYYLLQQHLDKHITPDEAVELEDMLQDKQQDPVVRETLQRFLEEQAVDSPGDISRWEGRIAAIVNMDKEGIPTLSKGRLVTIGRRGWVAAAVLIVLVSGSYLWFINNRKGGSSSANGSRQVQNEVLPGGNKATLTLAGGQKIVLDSAADGMLAQQGSATITKVSSGQLAYKTVGSSPSQTAGAATYSGAATYNTLSTPRGGQYTLILPDGTGVWLNAASSITYPTAFTGRQRAVIVTGEVYFEVAKDKAQPFHVKVNDMEVEVLGTHFNINSYADEAAIKTTLLEGSVKVTKGGSGRDIQVVVLKPGQQAQAAAQTGGQTAAQTATQAAAPIKVVNNANVDQVMAWKNGLFNFDKVSLQEVLRQLSRWYDVEVVYQGTITARKFGGEIGRDLNLSEVLDGLQETGIHFSVEGKKLIVMP